MEFEEHVKFKISSRIFIESFNCTLKECKFNEKKIHQIIVSKRHLTAEVHSKMENPSF